MDAAKMDALEGLVTEADAQGGPTPEQQQEQQQAQDMEAGAREWGAIAYMIGGALSMLAPELKPVYTEDRCLAWGTSVMPVAEKYGWNGPGSIPELGLAISTLGFAVPTALIIRSKLAELKEARQQAERDAASARPVSPLEGVQSASSVVVSYGS